MFAVSAAQLERFTQITQIGGDGHVEVAAKSCVIAATPFDNLHRFNTGKFLQQRFDHRQRCGPFRLITGYLQNDRDIVRLDNSQHSAPTLEAFLHIQRSRIHGDSAIRFDVRLQVLPALDDEFAAARPIKNDERVLARDEQFRRFAAGGQ